MVIFPDFSIDIGFCECMESVENLRIQLASVKENEYFALGVNYLFFSRMLSDAAKLALIIRMVCFSLCIL